MLGSHSGDGQVLGLTDIKQIVDLMRRGYFGHFCLLWNHKFFAKREAQTLQKVYLSAHTNPRNTKNTPFEDLSPPPPPEPEGEPAPPEAT